MGSLYTKSEIVNHFLSKVSEQVKCKAVRADIENELRDHIEDSVNQHLEEGAGEEKAYESAVKQMGDPTMIGIELNKTHSIQNAYLFYILVGISVLFGIISNFYYGYNLEYSTYFLWGLIVLFGVVTFGYYMIAKYTRLFSWLSAVLLFVLSMRVLTITWDHKIPSYHNSIFGVSFGYGITYLFIPLFVIMLYRRKNDGLLKLILPFSLILLPILIQNFYYYDRFLISAFAIFILGAFFTYTILVVRGYFFVGRKNASLLGIGCFAVILTAFISVYNGDNVRNMDGSTFTILGEAATLMVNPEKHATSAWEDGYNGVLIKKLLSKSELIGEIDLAQEELMEYGIGSWYFSSEEQMRDVEYLHYDVDDVTLEKILPQHYLNNYRVAYVILKFGWLAGILFLAALALAIVTMFSVTMRIRNSLGFALALSGSVLITLQMILYTLGNFGYQFGTFCNLPLISEGSMSVTVNMILIGLIISAYRYDRVIDIIVKKNRNKLRA